MKPLNPIGQCFESVGFVMLHDKKLQALNPRVIHAICRATAQEVAGQIIAHAWIECDDLHAYDTTWGSRTPAREYRKSLRVSYCKEYSMKEFFRKWMLNNYPGPWDLKIRAALAPNNSRAVERGP